LRSGGALGALPALEVTLAPEQQRLLELLHEHSDWVITLDRFFALDYYDSPNEPYLSKTARKYVLDYAPEFGEGLGHRMMLTTGSRDELGSLLGRAMNELGFAAVDQSVRQLLHYLKTVSGRLALQALGSSTSAAAAVGLGVVTAWLQSRGRLEQAVLVPVDLHPHLFSNKGSRESGLSDRRCDLVLFVLKRNIVEATFIEVKWRRGLVSLDNLAEDMAMQMGASAQAIRERFFNEKRVDGSLQRSALSNVLRFYFERARRYQLFDEAAEAAFLDNLGRLERTRAEFRASYEGYIVSLEDTPRKPLLA
jgi:DNA phosphorothioation-dependent restriction protein DptH